MCLLLIAIDVIATRPLLLLANRDEFHARDSTVAAPWPDLPDVIGGRDGRAGGSWLAVHRGGRLAAVTNIRLAEPRPAPLSRGALVRDFVAGQASAASYATALAQDSDGYAPFNLVVADAHEVWCVQSPAGTATPLASGVHVISNGPLDAPWPKMQRLREQFAAVAAAAPSDAALLDLLLDRTVAADALLPQTGVGLELERFLAPIFIRGEHYGTRAGSLAWRDAAGRVHLRERSFGADGECLGEAICS